MKFKSIILVLSFVFIVLSFSSCAHQKAKEKKEFAGDRILFKKGLDEWRRVHRKRQSLSGSGNISVKNHGKSISAPALLQLQWPDKMRLEIHDPFGSTQFLFILNGDRFWWQSVKNRLVYTGSVHHESVKKLLPIPLTIRELMQFFLARPLALAESGRHFQVNELYWLDKEENFGDEVRKILFFDQTSKEPELWLTKRVEKETETELRRISFLDYQYQHGLSVPMQSRVVFTKDQQNERYLVWRWLDVNAKVPRPDLSFKIYDKAQDGYRLRKFQ